MSSKPKLVSLLLIAKASVQSRGGAGAPLSPAAAADLRLRLVLHEALPQHGKQNPGAPSAILSLRKTGSVWERVWATAGNFNRKDHSGRVDAATLEDDGLELEVTLNVRGDPWVPGGWLVVKVELDRQEDSSLLGTYHGTWRDTGIWGLATARILPPSKTYAEPVKPTGHPRLLFRAGDRSIRFDGEKILFEE